MMLSEFKAWLDGLQTGLSGNPPTAEQWEALKAKLNTVTVEGQAAIQSPSNI